MSHTTAATCVQGLAPDFSFSLVVLVLSRQLPVHDCLTQPHFCFIASVLQAASVTQMLPIFLSESLVQAAFVMQALLVCEAAQKRSSVYAATRFACCALYGLLGAAGPAATNFDALAIKHIQHDSITGDTQSP